MAVTRSKSGTSSTSDTKVSPTLEELEERFEGFGVPEKPDKESPIVEPDDVKVDKNLVDAEPAGLVQLRNITAPEQEISIVVDGRYTGRTVRFTEGTALVDRETAELLAAEQSHMIFIEPTEGKVYTVKETGFSTRNFEAYEQYRDRLEEQNIGKVAKEVR